MNAPAEKAVSTGIAAYDEFRGQLAELKAANDSAVFDYHDKQGNKEARSHVHKLRRTKTAVDAARKVAKAESLAYGRKVDAEAKEIVQAIEDMMAVHMAPLKEIEDADLKRIADHRARIAEIEELGSDVSNMDYTAEQLGNRLRALKDDYPINASWEEFEQQAGRAKDQGVTSLESQIARREKYEAEQAELERLRKEAEERDAKEREERIAREAAEKARQEAEAEAERNWLAAEQAAEEKRLAVEQAAQEEREAAEKARQEAEAKVLADKAAAEQAAEAERLAAEKRELDLKLEAERAENARIAAENRAALAAQNAEREHQEKLKRAEEESARREADVEHRRMINCAAKEVLCKRGLPPSDAELVVRLIAEDQVPHVSIAY